MKTKLTLTIMMLIAILSVSQGATYDSQVILLQLEARLSQAKTAKDSIPILYDIYDATPRSKRYKPAHRLFWTAHNANDLPVMLDIIRLQGAITGDEKELQTIINQAKNLPQTYEQQETMLLLKMRLMSYHTMRPDYTIQDKELSDLIRKINASDGKPQNPHDQLLNLFTITSRLRINPDSKLLIGYLDSMVRLVNTRHYKLYALRNNIYAEASSIYSDAGLHEKAIEANRKNIALLDELEQHYHDNGRKYREYDMARYLTYCRMLRNYQALSLPEVEEIYSITKAIANRNSEVAEVIKKQPATEAYYRMARKEYNLAIPLLKQCIENDNSLIINIQDLDMLRTAAAAVGDKATLDKANLDYAKAKGQLDEQAISQKYQELRISAEINKLKIKNAELEVEKAQAETQAVRRTLSFIVVAWVLIAILLVITGFYWTRYRKNAEHLAGFARMMTRQRDRLKYNRYGEYDYDPYLTPKEKIPSKLRKHDAKTLIQSILSDIFYISAIGHDNRMKHIVPMSINTILKDSTGEAAPLMKNPDNVHVNYPEKDFNLITDPQCLNYIISHIILFAEKHSADDQVTLNVKHLEGSNMVYLIFSHAGMKIPTGHEESLFQDFVDWDEMRDIEDSALFICRMISFLLKCNIAYNPHSEGDPQLVVTIPDKITESHV